MFKLATAGLVIGAAPVSRVRAIHTHNAISILNAYVHQGRTRVPVMSHGRGDMIFSMIIQSKRSFEESIILLFTIHLFVIIRIIIHYSFALSHGVVRVPGRPGTCMLRWCSVVTVALHLMVLAR